MVSKRTAWVNQLEQINRKSLLILNSFFGEAIATKWIKSRISMCYTSSILNINSWNNQVILPFLIANIDLHTITDSDNGAHENPRYNYIIPSAICHLPMVHPLTITGLIVSEITK